MRLLSSILSSLDELAVEAVNPTAFKAFLFGAIFFLLALAIAKYGH